jgi:hypothetical protein
MAQKQIAFDAAESRVIEAADGLIGATITLREAMVKFVGNVKASLTDEAAERVKTLQEKVRTFNGEVVSVDSLRKSKEAARLNAVRRYDTISKAWIALRAEANGNAVTTKKKGRAIPVLITSKQIGQFAAAQSAALAKREKADFDLPRMRAAWMAIAAIANAAK